MTELEQILADALVAAFITKCRALWPGVTVEVKQRKQTKQTEQEVRNENR
jgi:hypothetical protein